MQITFIVLYMPGTILGDFYISSFKILTKKSSEVSIIPIL